MEEALFSQDVRLSTECVCLLLENYTLMTWLRYNQLH